MGLRVLWVGMPLAVLRGDPPVGKVLGGDVWMKGRGWGERYEGDEECAEGRVAEVCRDKGLMYLGYLRGLNARSSESMRRKDGERVVDTGEDGETE